MTQKDYIKIADVLGAKLEEVHEWRNAEAESLALAYIEDFMDMLEKDNPRFSREKFKNYLIKHYS